MNKKIKIDTFDLLSQEIEKCQDLNLKNAASFYLSDHKFVKVCAYLGLYDILLDICGEKEIVNQGGDMLFKIGVEGGRIDIVQKLFDCGLLFLSKGKLRLPHSTILTFFNFTKNHFSQKKWKVDSFLTMLNIILKVSDDLNESFVTLDHFNGTFSSYICSCCPHSIYEGLYDVFEENGMVLGKVKPTEIYLLKIYREKKKTLLLLGRKSKGSPFHEDCFPLDLLKEIFGFCFL